ncbi:30S ribosomal protein S8 [Enterobacteriaceae bacterium ET-AT1-13]|uniref:30S ribosomal protein S8 n=1 Tax=Cacopsylla melanoneura TaxID=428564 RepID=A0A8D8QEB6_9HEMI|nr:30S ribosomal protein S8 [Enterobacteriaceae bacterium ET-AT1-13]WGS66342.1 30S ribosomal protein S8 [Enterobacteriaceae bacterium Cmel17]WMC17365.1 MAG: 30S ribosomal protein S8 [Enterobacteriaceae bacterium Cmel21]WMC17572.1 MAG: 30S ribosomal protein S8 [Enterobacteriaceae bacterium PSmelAO3-2]WMC17777.1 MAG: 30S ribosomal protein S8 [Enterobacteriaceae bacterium PSmelAO3-1]WMC17980.1 MAG: 30S ribosomal protein S8 [Enterobacteriaceae bacterium PSmelAO1]
MSMHDPISDMLTYIRNGQNIRKKKIIMPFSNIKNEISRVLKDEGYIKDYKKVISNKIYLEIILKYYNNKPVIENIKRISKSSLRVYKKNKELPKVMNCLGIAIISTSKGIMSDSLARKNGIGGEIICYVY